ncbi:MAG: GspH/FimT family pseudopilin [Desulfosoma sp.]
MKSPFERFGFTLVELLVVMAIMAVSLALIFATVGSGLGRKQDRRFAVELGGLLRKARNQAMAGGVPVAVVFSEESRRCWIAEPGEGFVDIPAELEIQALGLLRAENVLYLVFYPDGASSGAELEVVRRGAVLSRIRVDPLTGLALAVVGEGG